MKILIVLLRIPGGVGRANTEIANALRKKGHEVDILSREDDLQKYSLKGGFLPIRRKVKKLMKEKNYDIIYTQDYSCALPLILPYPIFLRKHFYCSIGVKWGKDIHTLLQNFTGKFMRRKVIVLFHHNKKRFPRAHVIYRAVNIEKFRPLNKKRDSFGWINKFSEMGNQKIYEKVAKELELKPLSAGNPGRETKSKDKNKGKVVYHSFDKFSDMNEFYNKCKVFINLATPDAGFNLSWLEAMSAGVPIVIGNNNGAGPIMPFDKIDKWKNERDFEAQIKKISHIPSKILFLL